MTTENDLAKKLLQEFNKQDKSVWEFCAQKIQDMQKELREWKIAKMFAPRIAKNILEKKIQDYKQDVFNLDKTIVDTATNQVRVEIVKAIFNEIIKNIKPINKNLFSFKYEKYEEIKAKFLQEKKTK